MPQHFFEIRFGAAKDRQVEDSENVGMTIWQWMIPGNTDPCRWSHTSRKNVCRRSRRFLKDKDIFQNTCNTHATHTDFTQCRINLCSCCSLVLELIFLFCNQLVGNQICQLSSMFHFCPFHHSEHLQMCGGNDVKIQMCVKICAFWLCVPGNLDKGAHTATPGAPSHEAAGRGSCPSFPGFVLKTFFDWVNWRIVCLCGLPSLFVAHHSNDSDLNMAQSQKARQSCQKPFSFHAKACHNKCWQECSQQKITASWTLHNARGLRGCSEPRQLNPGSVIFCDCAPLAVNFFGVWLKRHLRLQI